MGLFRIAGMKYEEIIDTYATDIKQLAYTYVKDRQLAEDIAQETLLKCLTKGKKFKGESSLKTWLYKITVNMCKDHLKTSYQRKVTINNDLTQTLGGNTPSAEKVAFQHIETNDITDYVLALPEKYREIIVLHYFKELKVKEIAETLNLSENTVKTRLRRSRELLKEGMSKNE